MYQHLYQESVTQWETSYFGGFYGLLQDHPDIVLPEKIKVAPGCGNGYFLEEEYRKKLLDMFLYTVIRPDGREICRNCSGTLIDEDGDQCYCSDVSYVKKLIKDCSQPFDVDGKSWVKINPHSIGITLEDIIKSQSEIGLLFLEYRDIILSSEILFEVPQKDKKQKKSNSSNKSIPSNTSKKELIELFVNVLSKISEDKSTAEVKLIKDENNNFINSQIELPYREEYRTTILKQRERCSYNGIENTMSGRLTNMLNIDLDPKSDKVSNLKLGRLDAIKLAESLCGNTNVYYNIQENISTKPFSIAILADQSGSMDKFSSFQKSIMKILYKTFRNIIGDDKIFVFGHDTGELFVYQDRYRPNFETTINNYKCNGGTEDLAAITGVYEKVRTQTTDNTIFIMLTDAQPNGGNGERKKIKETLNKLKSDGFVTVGVGFDSEYMKNMFDYFMNIEEKSEKEILNLANLVNNVVKIEFQS